MAAEQVELDDTREDKQAAAQTRADAERLSDLTEAKQEQRRQDSSARQRLAQRRVEHPADD